MNIFEQRHRALQIIEEQLGNREDALADYTLDSLCRELLNLPIRPSNVSPYSGWMVGKDTPVLKHMRVSNEGVNFIKRWEGFRSEAYVCPAGVWTIGYGHTHTAKEGMCVTELQADYMLRRDLDYFGTKVASALKIQVNQEQFDALVSFAYNVGVGAYQTSTLLEKLNQGNFHAAAQEFDRWVHAKSKVLPGLVNRRKEEKEMFLKGE